MATAPDPIIRRANHNDRAALLQSDVFDGPVKVDSLDRFLGPKDAPDPRNLLYLAKIAGRIVGFVSATLIDHPDKSTSLFINELGVNEDAQRQGIGRALLAAIRAEGRRLGCMSSWVLTEADNVPARALYGSCRAEETANVVMYEWEEPDRES